jgi:type VI secretion system protein ImpC
MPLDMSTSDGSVLLQQILDEGGLVRATAEDEKKLQEKYARDLIGEFVDQVLDKKLTVSKDTVAAIQARIAEIDRRIGEQLDQILHAKEFKDTEARWRGLHYLVMNTETSTSLKIRVMNVSKKDLQKDFEAAPEFDRSALFKKVYEEEYGTFGGAPYGLLVGDYDFSASPTDAALLTSLAHVAAAAHAPFISAASPELFDQQAFTTLGVPGDLAKIFEGSQFIPWNEFRKKEDSRYVALTLPRVLMRLPYGGKNGTPVEGFQYEEDIGVKLVDVKENGKPVMEGGKPKFEKVGSKHENFLWGNSAYALGVRITEAFARYKWCAAIRGVEGGGLVSDLPVITFKAEDGDLAVKCPTEVTITDRRENELSELGFLALCYKKNSAQAAFFGGSTAQKPKQYAVPSANANARLSAQLPYILAASRFAHYIKVIMRDKIGSFSSREGIANFLNNWISDYVLLSDNAGQETKARLPLREARVDVTEVPGKPGSYRAVVFLKPHFQLNELTVSLRLVAELPPPAA